ncbi:MAG: TetR/AcrR family transcriptional regulator [Cyclobacteriaceae bacterium]
MSGLDTRNKVIELSIKLFNQNGIQNVRLQQIADNAQISVGNLAYHFHDKGQIVKRIDRMITEEMEKLIECWNRMPGFMDFDNHLNRTYYLLDKYSFYFLDILEIKRLYPEVHENQQKHIFSFIDRLRSWLEGSVIKGLLIKVDQPGQYQKVAEMIWFICSFWMSKKKILDQQEFHEGAFKEMIWQQLKPFFTEAGTSEFEIIIYPGLVT